ncbi:MAG: J domain-containing protein [Deltaproteobacteria bacterium]|nr:J domain-containing protein [Deltaproteobacteria bacterium]
MAKNFYLILGVPCDANTAEIRKAYRRLARQHHPDTGSGSIERFSELQEAYDTLADADARKRYDNSLCTPPPTRPMPSAPKSHPSRVAEELRPDDAMYSAHREYLQRPFGRQNDAATGVPFGRARSLSEAMRFFFGMFPPAHFASRCSHSFRSVVHQLVLSSRQAALGGEFVMELPLQHTCPACIGRGGIGPFPCDRCMGQGSVTAMTSITVSLPPGVLHNTRIRLPNEVTAAAGEAQEVELLISVEN